MKNAIKLAIVMLTLAAGNVMAKDWAEVRLSSEGAYPPFNETASDGSMRGLDIDIGNAICTEMKLKCSWVKGSPEQPGIQSDVMLREPSRT